MPGKPDHSVLFVCLGNICRSPLAEGVFRDCVARAGRAEAFRIDSAGTGGWHVGSPPDPRSVEVAARNGVALDAQRCRRIGAEDFRDFDLILAMDLSNLADLEAAAPPGHGATMALFMDYATGEPREVPDPYYGGADGFAEVYGMIRRASESLLERLSGRGPDSPRSGQASSTT